MTTRRRVNNPLALAVLGCLLERPMHPYEMSTTLRERNKEASIKLNYGTLYSVVESLQKHGLVTARETTREGRRPARTVYEITEGGAREFEDWLSELISTPVRDFTSLEAGLSLMAGLPPDVVVPLLAARLDRLDAEIGGLDAMHQVARDRGLPDLFVVESQFRHAMLSAERAFVAGLAKDIRTGALGGTKAWRRMHELLDSGMSMDEIMADPAGNLGEEAAALGAPPGD